MIAKLHKINKRYMLDDVQISALCDVDLTIPRGELTVLAGPSGSGKSTLLHILGCIDKPSGGTIVIDETDVTALPLENLARLRAEKIGFVFQSFNLIPVLTAYENVELPLLFKKLGSSEIHSRVVEALTKVGLKDRMNHSPGKLSGGQRQRAAIARALVGNPRLILADEPTANLDSRTGAEIIDLLLQLNQSDGVTIVIATHDSNILRKVNTIINMRDGKICK